MNSGPNPWKPSDELRHMLKRTSITPNELSSAVFECFEYLLGKPGFSQVIIKQQYKKAGVSLETPTKEGLRKVIDNLEKHSTTFQSQECIQLSKSRLVQFVNHCKEQDLSAMVDINTEADIVTSRNAGLEIAKAMGFSGTDCNKIATAISELARNIVRYAGKGVVVINEARNGSTKGIEIVAKDWGPGIENLDDILNGDYQSKDGMGSLDIETGKTGTTIRSVKYLR